MPLPAIEPPLLNSANPWATTAEDIQKLFDCSHTGAVTTRTSLLQGFEHDDKVHQYAFFSPNDQTVRFGDVENGHIPNAYGGSLNTLGYSPLPLSQYLSFIPKVIRDSSLPVEERKKKIFILSITGSVEATVECYRRIRNAQASTENPLCMEINLSCPNIPNKPPPAYSRSSLGAYLKVLKAEKAKFGDPGVSIGIKTPPYTYHDQFQTLIDALLEVHPECPIDFITATNTLGSCLLFSDGNGAAALQSLSGAGIGGMAGAPLHPLALGNVKTLRSMLDKHSQLKSIDIIGVGGVSDRAAFDRMTAVGARAVGVGTALGRRGVVVFQKILNGQEED